MTHQKALVGFGSIADAISIQHYQWTQAQQFPEVHIFLSYTKEAFQLSFHVYEENPLIRYTRQNEPVYQDSCVEFFIQPTPDRDARYLNLEMNAAGTLLVGLGKDRLDRLYIEPEDHPPLHIRTEINRIDETNGKIFWSAELRIPMDWLSALFPGFAPVTGSTLRGNFYKCGDETASPHYGSWSKVNSNVPDFHRSEDFGWLTLA
ncbi:carbohydrate-binding family 9-like protein [Paenibacillus paridis]|uniref:carbohydrate-binding family 9-like protein n=1 Tax=Paenibacillus paridis TaxID=2583376 RepID=UPI00112114B0|nr:carbohydrate-binding family 9-like protein [Paenibacillus paridis]